MNNNQLAEAAKILGVSEDTSSYVQAYSGVTGYNRLREAYLTVS